MLPSPSQAINSLLPGVVLSNSCKKANLCNYCHFFFLRTIYIFKLYLPSLILQNYFPSKNIILFDQMIFSSWHEGKVITIEIGSSYESEETHLCAYP